MHLTSFLLISVLATASVSAPATSSRHVLHEKRTLPLRAWEKRGRVKPSQILPVRIGLTQRNLELGPGLLDDV